MREKDAATAQSLQAGEGGGLSLEAISLAEAKENWFKGGLGEAAGFPRG